MSAEQQSQPLFQPQFQPVHQHLPQSQPYQSQYQYQPQHPLQPQFQHQPPPQQSDPQPAPQLQQAQHGDEPEPSEPTRDDSRRNKELTPYLRGQIVGMSKAGMTANGIARNLGISPHTVKKTIRMDKTRIDGKTLPRSGAPRILSDEQEQQIRDLVKQNPHLTYAQIREQVGTEAKDGLLRKLLATSKLKLVRGPAPAAKPRKKAPSRTTATSNVSVGDWT